MPGGIPSPSTSSGEQLHPLGVSEKCGTLAGRSAPGPQPERGPRAAEIPRQIVDRGPHRAWRASSWTVAALVGRCGYWRCRRESGGCSPALSACGPSCKKMRTHLVRGVTWHQPSRRALAMPERARESFRRDEDPGPGSHLCSKGLQRPNLSSRTFGVVLKVRYVPELSQIYVCYRSSRFSSFFSVSVKSGQAGDS